MVATFHLHYLGHRLKYQNCEVGNTTQQYKYCQQHDHATVLSLLNHFYFESFSSHIIWIYIFVYIFIKLAIFILFLLTSTVMFFLHCMLNTLRHEKIFCEIDESIAYYDYLLLLTII